MMSALNDKHLFCAMINGIIIQLLCYLMNMVAFRSFGVFSVSKSILAFTFA